jgi:hypothetical protein
MDVIYAACFLALILLIWFKTDAFVEYCKLFGIKKLFKLEGYFELNDPILHYVDYLIEYYNNFFTRLISCPICVSTWIGLLFSYFIGIVQFPAISILGLFIYLLIAKLI